MSVCAATGVAPATAASVYTPPGPATSESKKRYGTGAEVCSAGDSSCLMQIGGGLSRLRSGVRTVHLAEILAAG